MQRNIINRTGADIKTFEHAIPAFPLEKNKKIRKLLTSYSSVTIIDGNR